MEDFVPIFILSTYFGLLALERLVPARALPVVKRWTLKGLAFLVVTMLVNGGAPALVAMAIGDLSPLGLSSLGLLGGAATTFLAAELLNYGLHRAFHTVPVLWRWVHQLHHAAERLDILGSAFVHPLEVATGAAITTLMTALLGVTPEAAALAGMASVFCVLFQHCNVHTPSWIGYVIQRPEAHSVHHARGVHAYNYANFTPIDMLFGTFRNPEQFVATQGLWDGASAELGALLLGRDVSQPRTQALGAEAMTARVAGSV